MMLLAAWAAAGDLGCKSTSRVPQTYMCQRFCTGQDEKRMKRWNTNIECYSNGEASDELQNKRQSYMLFWFPLSI